jgi:amino acid permease
MLIYLIVLSSTIAEFIAGFFTPTPNQWYFDRQLYVALVGVILLYFVVKKDLAEIRWLAWLLVVSIGLFIFMSFLLLVFDSRYTVDPTAQNDIWWPKKSP